MPTNILLNFIEQKLAQSDTPPAPAPSLPRSLAKGLLAGMIGGLVATVAKSVAEKVYPPRTEGQPEPPELLAEKLAGHELAPVPKAIASETLHWGFGAATGAAYGALAEYYPAATAREGINFGMTLMALTHEGALPALGLSAEPADQTVREKSSEMVSHILFGLVAETVRRTVRKAL